MSIAAGREGLEMLLAGVSAAHGYEWGDGLDLLYCDCGWVMDAYIDYEEGLAERAPADHGREIAVLIRHRAHVSAEQAAAILGEKA